MHQNIEEALKALELADANYAQACEAIDRQYLKALAASHDGESDACVEVLEQVEFVRGLYREPKLDGVRATDGVKPRF